MRSASLLVALFLLFGGVVSRQPAEAVDWMTLPGTYTHDPITAHRVDRFAEPKPSLAPVDPTFRSSGYTHMRSTIQVGESMDSYHRVNQWGTTPVRPYGEWRFPYRPYSAPYPDWGAPFAGFNAWPPGLFPPFPHPGFGGGPGGGPPGAGPPGAGGAGGWGGTGGWGGAGGQWGGPGGGWGGPGGYPPGQPINPYPIDPRGPYPAPPWFDGSYPSLPFRPYLNDRQFFFNPSQSLPGN